MVAPKYGQSGADVFDLIEVDLASAHEVLEAGKLYTATILASRALLVTQGQEAGNDAEALDLFAKHFIEPGLVNESFRSLIENCKRSIDASDPENAFVVNVNEVSALVETVHSLYNSMDQSLRFQPVKTDKPKDDKTTASPVDVKLTIDREVDFRGVACPLNYVKTKLLLERMSRGQVLSVLLDGDGARNVLESAKQDGHEVLLHEKQGNHWRVALRKS